MGEDIDCVLQGAYSDMAVRRRANADMRTGMCMHMYTDMSVHVCEAIKGLAKAETRKPWLATILKINCVKNTIV